MWPIFQWIWCIPLIQLIEFISLRSDTVMLEGARRGVYSTRYISSVKQMELLQKAPQDLIQHLERKERKVTAGSVLRCRTVCNVGFVMELKSMNSTLPAHKPPRMNLNHWSQFTRPPIDWSAIIWSDLLSTDDCPGMCLILDDWKRYKNWI
jgi:hypothetical protein